MCMRTGSEVEMEKCDVEFRKARLLVRYFSLSLSMICQRK